MPTTPFRYQLEDARAIHRFGGRCLVANEMGTGKSLTALLFAQQHPEDRPVIIVCPASIKFQWELECKKHFNWRAEVLEGRTPSRHAFTRRHQILILNYDIIDSWLEYLRELHAKLVIIDECGSYLGNPSTQRTKAVRKLCAEVPHVIALSGTPLVNRPAELWPTLNILRPDLFRSFWPFGMRYCGPRMIPWGCGRDFRGASHLGELHAMLFRDLAIRRRKIDVLKHLPSKQRYVVPLALTNPKEYEHAHNQFLDWLSKRDPTKLSAALRAEQLVRLGTLKRLAARLKLPYVFEWIDSFLKETEEKLVVFGIHREILGQLQQLYSKFCVLVDGQVKGRDRQLAVDKFQTHANTRLFLGNIKAAGIGLNLTAASTVAFCECDWTPGAHVQGEDRCHRIGTTSSVSIYYLVAHGTIEEYLVQIIQEKQRVLSAVMDGGNGEDLNVFEQLTQALVKGTADANQ